MWQQQCIVFQWRRSHFCVLNFVNCFKYKVLYRFFYCVCVLYLQIKINISKLNINPTFIFQFMHPFIYSFLPALSSITCPPTFNSFFHLWLLCSFPVSIHTPLSLLCPYLVCTHLPSFDWYLPCLPLFICTHLSVHLLIFSLHTVFFSSIHLPSSHSFHSSGHLHYPHLHPTLYILPIHQPAYLTFSRS